MTLSDRFARLVLRDEDLIDAVACCEECGATDALLVKRGRVVCHGCDTDEKPSRFWVYVALALFLGALLLAAEPCALYTPWGRC